MSTDALDTLITTNYTKNKIAFVNVEQFAKKINLLKIICTNNSVPEYIFNKLSNISESIHHSESTLSTYSPNDNLLLEILHNVCPTRLTDICKLFDLYSENDTANRNIKGYCDYCDMLFTCTSVSVISISDILSNKDKYHMFDEWLLSQDTEDCTQNIPFGYFNNVNTGQPRATTNDNKKNILTLKIKNEDLREDLLTLNLLFRFIGEEKNDYLLSVKVHVVNDSYNTIRNDHEFRKYFKLNSADVMYNKIHLRDCCLSSLNGGNPLDYISKVYSLIGSCNELCNSSTDPHLDINIKNNKKPCGESSHFIQKFAKYCFHTKYLTILYASENHPNVCIFLAVILVRCNNRLCREFLETLPDLIKQMIMTHSGIGGLDESKTETNLNDKMSLSQRVNVWKQLFANKYNMNVKKIIEKCNELCSEDDKNASPFSENAEKDRVKKMISNFEKISIRFFLLSIHSQLINLIDHAKNIYPTWKIESIHDVILARQSDKSNCRPFDLNITAMSSSFDKELSQYLKNFTLFEQKIRNRILHISEGQMTVKKAIWQYIMDVVTNYNPIATRKILCLIGPPGVGKTFIALCIARILFFEPDETPSENEVKNLVHIISVPGITNENSLLGSNAVYVGARPGIITKETLFNDQLFRKLIIYDEIDKKCNFIDQLLPVLDYTQNSKIVDNYFEIEVDMRVIFQIATANDRNAINPILRDRMYIVDLNGYSTYTKCNIIQKQMLGSLLEERGSHRNLIYLPEPVLEYIILTRTREAGVRKLKNILIEIINTVNLAIMTDMANITTNLNKYTISTKISDNEAYTLNISNKKVFTEYYKYEEHNIKELYSNIVKRYLNYMYSLGTGVQSSIIITKNDVDIILADKQKIKMDHINDVADWGPGKIIGLYATTMGVGGILPIAMKFNKTHLKKGMLITLGAQKTMKDSAMISHILTSDYFYKLNDNVFTHYLGIHRDEFIARINHIANNSALHVLLDSSISKDGPSAGGAFVISHISKILGHVLSNKVGITGEISNNFKITAIGGINMKVNGAMHAGCRAVIAPNQNIGEVYSELVNQNSIDVKNMQGKRCAFIYYSENEGCYILLIRAKPSNDINSDLSSFDINITQGSTTLLNTYNSTVPSLFRFKLKQITSESDLISPTKGLDIELYKHGRATVTLRQIMTNYFTIFAMENIPNIYYLMVMAKHVYNPEFYNSAPTTNIIDPVKAVEYDGIELTDRSIEKIRDIEEPTKEDE